MTTSTHDVDALKRMQSDAENLRAGRKRKRSTQTPADDDASGTGEEPNTTETQAETTGEAQALESETDVQHYADHLAGAVKQLEDAAREHPALALLAAFTTGIVVGNLFSRR